MSLMTSQPPAPGAMRVISVIVIGLSLFAAVMGIWKIVDPHLSASTATYAWAIGGCAQAVCQYLSVYRLRRVPALVAAILPLLAVGVYAAAEYRLFAELLRRPIAALPLLIPQLLPALLLVALAVLMFVWFLRLTQRVDTIELRSQRIAAIVNGPRNLKRATRSAFLLSGIVLAISFVLMPKDSGAPGGFGALVQPLSWFGAAAVAGLGVVLAFLSAQTSSLGQRVALVISVVVLGIVVAQFLFALLGPNL